LVRAVVTIFMGGETGDRRLPDAVVAELLESPDHREVLHALARKDEPLRVEDLAGEAAVEHSSGGTQVIVHGGWIYQDVLPKLTATGVVEFDSVCATLELTPLGESILDDE
jgi:hypothetical protein